MLHTLPDLHISLRTWSINRITNLPEPTNISGHKAWDTSVYTVMNNMVSVRGGSAVSPKCGGGFHIKLLKYPISLTV